MIFTVPLVVQISIFCKLCKNAEKSWNLKTLKLRKTMVIFAFPTLKLVLKSKWRFAKIFFIHFIGFSSYSIFSSLHSICIFTYRKRNKSKIFCFSLCSIRIYVKKTVFKKDAQSLNKSFLMKVFFDKMMFSLCKRK